MNCRRCHHTHEAHSRDPGAGSLMGAGGCAVPTCTCSQYLDPIHDIDEDLL